MSFETDLTQIESAAFSIRVNVASGLATAVRALAAEPAFVRLGTAIRGDAPLSLKVLQRVRELARLNVDPRFTNPHDVALAAYVLALNDAAADSKILGAAASLAVSLPNGWWSRSVGMLVLDGRKTHSDDVETIQHSSASLAVIAANGLVAALGLGRSHSTAGNAMLLFLTTLVWKMAESGYSTSRTGSERSTHVGFGKASPSIGYVVSHSQTARVGAGG